MRSVKYLMAAGAASLMSTAALAADIDQRLFGIGVPFDLYVLVAHRVAGFRVDEANDQAA